MSFDEITITLSDPDGNISVESLTKQLEDALDMLRSVSADVVASGVKVRWEVVRVRMRSPLKLTVSPRITGSRSVKRLQKQVVSACLNGVKEIEKGAIMPQHFTEETLDAAKRIAKRREKASFSSNGKDKVTLTEKAAKHIDEIAAKARLYIDFSTIEGYLEIVSVHDRASFFIWEILTNHKVECFGNEEQFDKALLLLKKKPRLAVTGRVHFRNHIPRSIDVETVDVLPDASELPQPKDIGPINITDGVSSEEFIRRARDA